MIKLMNKTALVAVSICCILFAFFILTVFIIVIFSPVSPISTLVRVSSSKDANGYIYDCATTQPIDQASVAATTVGWGIRNGLLVWDKVYLWNTSSNLAGIFVLEKSSGVELTVKKDGYHPAKDYSYEGKRSIGLLPITGTSNSSEETFGCKLSSECYKSVVLGDQDISWNDCTSPELNPSLNPDYYR